VTITLLTIGFAETSAESFFGALRGAGARRVVDVRLNNTSQLAGYSKRDDLRYFLRELGAIDYAHLPQFAPTQEMLDLFKKQKGPWDEYEGQFNRLMVERRVESTVEPREFHLACLLCSEKSPVHCHRRLVAEYLQRAWSQVSIQHLG